MIGVIWAVLAFFALVSVHAALAGMRRDRAIRDSMRRHPANGELRRRG